jgi:hypothetical protein
MKYDVTVYAVARVKVVGIEAENREDAIRQVQLIDLDYVLQKGRVFVSADDQQADVLRTFDIDYVAYADDLTGFLIDEEGDCERSFAYDRDGKELS